MFPKHIVIETICDDLEDFRVANHLVLVDFIVEFGADPHPPLHTLPHLLHDCRHQAKEEKGQFDVLIGFKDPRFHLWLDYSVEDLCFLLVTAQAIETAN